MVELSPSAFDALAARAEAEGLTAAEYLARVAGRADEPDPMHQVAELLRHALENIVFIREQVQGSRRARLDPSERDALATAVRDPVIRRLGELKDDVGDLVQQMAASQTHALDELTRAVIATNDRMGVHAQAFGAIAKEFMTFREHLETMERSFKTDHLAARVLDRLHSYTHELQAGCDLLEELVENEAPSQAKSKAKGSKENG